VNFDSRSTNGGRIKENIHLDFELSGDQIKCLDDIRLEKKYANYDPRKVV
jgi:hypothetical protein